MGKDTLFDKLRYWISGIAFDVFLWANRMTANEYLSEIERRAIDAYIGPIMQSMSYWMHEEEGRVCSCKIQPSDRWYRISEEQYKQITEKA